MREALAHAINSSHLEEKEWETSIDKIKALGYAARLTPVGVEAIHLIDSLQPKSYQQLIYLLAKKAQGKFNKQANREMTIRMCHQVIRESAFKFCHVCAGRKELKAGERVITCHSCQGSGLHRHTDIERAQALQIPLEAYQKHWVRRFQTVEAIFTDEMKESLVMMKIKLERIK